MRALVALAGLGLVAIGPAYAQTILPQPGPATVIRIIDADTLRIRLPGGKGVRTVRIRDIDAPELKGRCRAEIELAERAKARLEELAPPGSTVHLSAIKADKYESRFNAKVRGPYGDVSELLIGESLARPYNGGKRQPWC